MSYELYTRQQAREAAKIAEERLNTAMEAHLPVDASIVDENVFNPLVEEGEKYLEEAQGLCLPYLVLAACADAFVICEREAKSPFLGQEAVIKAEIARDIADARDRATEPATADFDSYEAPAGMYLPEAAAYLAQLAEDKAHEALIAAGKLMVNARRHNQEAIAESIRERAEQEQKS